MGLKIFISRPCLFYLYDRSCFWNIWSADVCKIVSNDVWCNKRIIRARDARAACISLLSQNVCLNKRNATELMLRVFVCWFFFVRYIWYDIKKKSDGNIVCSAGMLRDCMILYNLGNPLFIIFYWLTPVCSLQYYWMMAFSLKFCCCCCF
jgi:hypothetical protein